MWPMIVVREKLGICFLLLFKGQHIRVVQGHSEVAVLRLDYSDIADKGNQFTDYIATVIVLHMELPNTGKERRCIRH